MEGVGLVAGGAKGDEKAQVRDAGIVLAVETIVNEIRCLPSLRI
jgi:hypothetical protein